MFSDGEGVAGGDSVLRSHQIPSPHFGIPAERCGCWLGADEQGWVIGTGWGIAAEPGAASDGYSDDRVDQCVLTKDFVDGGRQDGIRCGRTKPE